MLRGKVSQGTPLSGGQMQATQNGEGSHIIETMGSYTAFASVVGGSMGGYWLYSQIQELKKHNTDLSSLIEQKVVPITNNHSTAMKDIGEFIKKTNDRLTELEHTIKKLKKDKNILLEKLDELSITRDHGEKKKSKKKVSKKSREDLTESSSELSRENSDELEQSSGQDKSEKSVKSKSSERKKESKEKKYLKKDRKHGKSNQNTELKDKKNKDKDIKKELKKELKKEHDDAFDD